MKLFLTVGIHDEQRGLISLWDHEMSNLDQPSAGKLREHYVELELTPEQERQLTFDGVRPVNVAE